MHVSLPDMTQCCVIGWRTSAHKYCWTHFIHLKGKNFISDIQLRF